LTKQLTVLSGSLWNKTLQGARAQRIEMLLLHDFHDRKFILPEKFTGRDRFALEAAQQQQAGAGKGKKGGKKGPKAAAAGAGEVEGDAADGPQVSPQGVGARREWGTIIEATTSCM
jgi:DNA polymerase alpha subunit A